MKKLLWLPLCLLLGNLPGSAQASEFILHIRYQVSCPNQKESSFPGLNAVLHFGGQNIRADFWKYETEKQILLTTASEPSSKPDLNALQFQWDENSDCHLDSFNPEWIDASKLGADQAVALQHAPILSVRKDQMTFRQVDLPLALTYTLSDLENGNRLLRYTLYLSNESSHGVFTTSKASSLLHYGRRTDIEWIYDLELKPDGTVGNERFQGGKISGFGHSTKTFPDASDSAKAHRTLFNIAKHNVFSDRGVLRDVYRMVPSEEISIQEARETWMLKHPWSFAVSDRELAKAGRLSAPSEDYIYLFLKAKAPNSEAKIVLKARGSLPYLYRYKRLQNSLGGYCGSSALRLTEEDQAKGGDIEIRQARGADRFESPRFYRVKKSLTGELSAVEVTSQFACDEHLNCRF